jgi:hypothetical protein
VDNKTPYDTDFLAWTQEQVRLLKSHSWDELDVENLVEELESLGRKERLELRNRLGILLGHLLKWNYQPKNRSNSWLATIDEQREEIQLLLIENPSLKNYLEGAFVLGYRAGIKLAVRETNLPYKFFPEVNPFTLEQVLNPKFLP